MYKAVLVSSTGGTTFKLADECKVNLYVHCALRTKASKTLLIMKWPISLYTPRLSYFELPYLLLLS